MELDSRLSSFRKRLAGKIDPCRFNRLIESAADAEKNGRLRFWQERFLDNLPIELTDEESKFLDGFGGYSSFLYLFGNAERLSYTVSRQEFDANPFKYLEDLKCDVDDDWIRSAWGTDRFRSDVAITIGWSMMLAGNLDETDGMVKTLVRVLTDEEAFVLYKCIDIELKGSDEEWRPQFVRVFPGVEPLLPPSEPEKGSRKGVTPFLGGGFIRGIVGGRWGSRVVGWFCNIGARDGRHT